MTHDCEIEKDSYQLGITEFSLMSSIFFFFHVCTNHVIYELMTFLMIRVENHRTEKIITEAFVFSNRC